MTFLICLLGAAITTAIYYIAREVLMYRVRTENPRLFDELRKTHPWFLGVTPSDRLLEIFENPSAEASVSSIAQKCVTVLRVCVVSMVVFASVGIFALVLNRD